jgi:hypothetical protein
MGTTVSADRRDPSAPRRTIKTTVDLTPGDERDTWQADSIDLSLRGMAMRASVLPEVGESLGVRFHPEGGVPVSARAEVVWASDQGRHAGTFGVRFTELSPQVERSLRRMLDAKDDVMIDRSAPPPTDARVKLFIHGMDAPLRARVRTSNPSELVVGSELSFLKLGDKVDVDHAGTKVAGTIVKVDVEVDAKTRVPRLILSIDLGARRKPDLGTAPTVLAESPRGTEPDLPAHASPKQPVQTAVLRADEVPAAPPAARGRAAQGTCVLGAEASPAEPSAERSQSEAELSLVEAPPGWITQGMQVVRRAGERVMPALRRSAGAVGQFVQRVRARRHAEETGGDMGPVSAPRRGLRPQHQPQESTASTSAEGDALGTQPGRTRKVGLYALVGVIVVAGIVAYASTSGPKVETPRPQVAVAPEGASDPAVSSPVGDSSVAPPEVEDEPVAPSQPAPRMVQGRSPRTADLAAAASAHGDLEAPVIQSPQPRVPRSQPQRPSPAPTVRSMSPSLPQRVTATPVQVQRPVLQTTGATVAQRPAAQAVTVQGAAHPPVVFGNPALRNGTVLRLRMDGPITAIQGVGARGASIVMTVPGRRSLDMAAPLAQVDPRIAGAGVMNRATGAELTLRFREPAPPFVARSRGNVLEIVLAPTPGQPVRAGARVPSVAVRR